MYKNRVKKLRSRFSEDKLDAFLVVKKENRRYLSGFTGSDGSLLIMRKKSFLLTDSRYHIQAKREAPDFELLDITSNFLESFSKIIKQEKVKRLGFESNHLSFWRYQRLKKFLKGTELIPVIDLVENLRSIKSRQELNYLVRAQEITDRAFQYIMSHLKEGLTEKQVAWELEKYMREKGAEILPFAPILASGINAAEPHHKSSDKKIKSGEMVILDFGTMVSGYSSDMTRTVFLGEPTRKQVEMYKLVLSSQKAALKRLKAGVTGQEIDDTARKVIESRDLRESFRHNVGHGVGLETHEKPTLGPSHDGFLLAANMVCTIEPGIYLPKWGGIRIEDMALVQEDGAKVLTKSPKELDTVVI